MRRRYGFLTGIMAATSLACSRPSDEPVITQDAAAAPVSATDSANRASDVKQLVQMHLDAMATGNAVRLDSLTASHALHVTADGKAMNEAQLLEKHRAGPSPRYEVQSIDVRVINGDVGVVNAKVREPGGALHHLTQVWFLTSTGATHAMLPARAPRAMKLVSTRPQDPPPEPAATACCATGKWELATSHASPSSDPAGALPNSNAADPNTAKPGAKPVLPNQ